MSFLSSEKVDGFYFLYYIHFFILLLCEPEQCMVFKRRTTPWPQDQAASAGAPSQLAGPPERAGGPFPPWPQSPTPSPKADEPSKPEGRAL